MTESVQKLALASRLRRISRLVDRRNRLQKTINEINKSLVVLLKLAEVREQDGKK